MTTRNIEIEDTLDERIENCCDEVKDLLIIHQRK